MPRGAGGLGTAGGPSPASPRPPLQCCRASRCRRWPGGWRARRTPCVSCGPPAGSSGLASTPAPSAAEPPRQRRSPNIYRPRPAPPWQRHPQGTRGPACPCRAPSGKGKGLQGRAPAPALPPPGTEGALPSMTSSNQVLENCHHNHIPGVAGADGRHSPSPATAVPGEWHQPDPGRHRQHWGPRATHLALVSHKRTLPRRAAGMTRGRSGPPALARRRHTAAHHQLPASALLLSFLWLKKKNKGRGSPLWGSSRH